MEGPSYILKDFVKDCAKNKSKVTALRNAKRDAKFYFKLDSEEAILEFIGNEELKNPQFIRQDLLRKKLGPNLEIIVDAYSFYTDYLFGYLAFFYQAKTGKWIIKSFKKNTDPDPRDSVLTKINNLSLH